MVTSGPSPFGTGECRANAIAEGAFPTRTQTRLTEREDLCPNRYQHLPVSMGGWGHNGSQAHRRPEQSLVASASKLLYCLGTLLDSSSRQPSGQELALLTKMELTQPGMPDPAATAWCEREQKNHFCLQYRGPSQIEPPKAFPPPGPLNGGPSSGWVAGQLEHK